MGDFKECRLFGARALDALLKRYPVSLDPTKAPHVFELLEKEQSKRALSDEQTAELFWSNFLNESLAHTSSPVLEEGMRDKTLPARGVILEIVDFREIGHSALTMLKEVNRLLKTIPEPEKQKISLPKKLIKLMLSDGYTLIPAVGMDLDFNILMPLGTKILVKNSSVRLGLVILYENQVTFLGGSDQRLLGVNSAPLVRAHFALSMFLNKRPEEFTV